MLDVGFFINIPHQIAEVPFYFSFSWEFFSRIVEFYRMFFFLHLEDDEMGFLPQFVNVVIYTD